ncbi:uncharacterized protein TEOVI_000247000 [Trypanosoma equiperdum]|uniref:Uncharacterized protein n=1 Tax=Trypanosoma equiperdum TaxID=5694 RepID=A0A1G4IF05_TRYEQ|nr:hypothetical protein, conserved [Trypanosoma equiperdum]
MNQSPFDHPRSCHGKEVGSASDTAARSACTRCRGAATHGLAVGETVYAPKRSEGKPLRYALAEVTGIQATARTVTVSFLGTEPGVDDEAVPFYTVVPSPGEVIPTVDNTNGGAYFSPFRRVGKSGAGAGSTLNPPRGKGGKTRVDPAKNSNDNELSGVEVCRRNAEAPERGIPTLCQLAEAFPSDVQQRNGWRVLCVPHHHDESFNAFSARAFGAACLTMNGCLKSAPRTTGGWVVLSVFTTYDSLHHFDVYMTLRGYRVCLADGTVHPTGFRGGPAVSSIQYDERETLWLCILADDIANEGSASALVGEWLPCGVQRQHPNAGKCGDNLIKVGVVQFVEEWKKEKVESEPWMESDDVERAIRKLLAAVGADAHTLIKCHLPDHVGEDELVISSLMSDGSTVIGSKWWKQSRSSSTVRQRTRPTFELCLPATSWQIDLLRALEPRGGLIKQEDTDFPPPSASNAADNEYARGRVSSPTPLQAIANGDVFNTALSRAVACGEGAGLLRDLQRRVVCNAGFLGEEVSPLFCAIHAVLQDVLPQPESGTAVQWKRVVICLPGVSNRASASVAYRHAIQRFLYPWRLHFLATDEWQRTSDSATMESLSWLQMGGVMLLSMEEPLCQLSSLKEEADIVIECGKCSATPRTPRDGVTHIVLFSEVEIPGGPTPLLSSWRPANKAIDRALEQAVVRRTMSHTQPSVGTHIFMKAAALIEELDGKENHQTERRMLSRKRQTVEDEAWVHLRKFAVHLLVCSCHFQETR